MFNGLISKLDAADALEEAFLQVAAFSGLSETKLKESASACAGHIFVWDYRGDVEVEEFISCVEGLCLYCCGVYELAADCGEGVNPLYVDLPEKLADFLRKKYAFSVPSCAFGFIRNAFCSVITQRFQWSDEQVVQAFQGYGFALFMEDSPRIVDGEDVFSAMLDRPDCLQRALSLSSSSECSLEICSDLVQEIVRLARRYL